MHSVSRQRKPVNLCGIGGMFNREMREACEQAIQLSESPHLVSNRNIALTNKEKSCIADTNKTKIVCTGKFDCSHCANERQIVLSYMRREISHVQLEEDQLVWSELREHVLYLYKTLRESTVGPTVIGRVKHLVDRLCEKDPQQLYLRLEILATDVVKQSLESVERIFVNELRNSTIAHNYLENIIADCDNLLLAARKMTPMLRNLEKYLKEYNTCWLLLHQNLFRIHYLDDVRCKIRAKRARLLLLKDIEIPAFTETILKFSQFVEALNTLAGQWIGATAKLHSETRETYRYSRTLLCDEWQNLPRPKKPTKASLETVVNPAEKPKQQKREKENCVNCGVHINDGCSKSQFIKQTVPEKHLQSTPETVIEKLILTKSQAKKARRKAKADHRRQPSTDLMPPPPPRLDAADLAASINSMRLEPSESPKPELLQEQPGRLATRQRLRDTLRKKNNEPNRTVPVVNPSPPTAPIPSDNRDVDELVAFVEGVKIDVKKDEDINIKKDKKKLKKENQRLKKMQTIIEQDQVAQLIKRSPEVTITMIKPSTTCDISSSKYNHTRSMLKSERCPIVPPKPAVPVISPQLIVSKPAVTPSPKITNTSPSNTCVTNPGSRMVTIRRINEANTDEPTVTITLKGATPDQDQVLYRIINGQADYGHLGGNANTTNANSKNNLKDEESSQTGGAVDKRKKKKKKNKNRAKCDVAIEEIKLESDSEPNRENTGKCCGKVSGKGAVHNKEVQTEMNVEKDNTRSEDSISSPSCSKEDERVVSKQSPTDKHPFITIIKKRKKSEPSDKSPRESPIDKVSITVERQTFQSKVIKNSNMKTNKNSQKSVSAKIGKSKLEKQTKQPEQTKQFRNEFNNPATNKARTDAKQVHFNREQKSYEFRASNVRAETQSKSKQHSGTEPYENRPKPMPIYCSPPPFQSKHRTKHYSTDWDNDNDASKLIPENLRLPAGITITKVPSTTTRRAQYQSDTRSRSMTLADTSRQSFAESVLKNKPDLPPDVTILERNFYAPPVFTSPAAAASTVSASTVTVAVPPTLQLPVSLPLTPSQQLQSQHLFNSPVPADYVAPAANRQPPIGTGVPRQSEPTARFYQTSDGRVTIRGPMVRSTTPPLNPLNMIQQDIEMGVHATPVNCWSRSDWWPPGAENVFAPKNIDLEDKSLDAEERELEAFKRFCQEPVPPQRQEVTHLNVQNIVIKKNQQS